MSRAIHFGSQPYQGIRTTDGINLSNSGVSGISVSVSLSNCEHTQKAKLYFRGPNYRTKIFCASSSSHRRNPDFSRPNKFSRSRKKQGEERGNYENVEESDVLYSKNEASSASFGSSKFQATAIPGPKEKEIVELFRKVQAQLQERAAKKVEKKVDKLQKNEKESEDVSSLLKLLRKHSVQQEKRTNESDSISDFVLYQSEQNSSISDKNTSIFVPNGSVIQEKQENISPIISRPRSNFQRRSPVPPGWGSPIYSNNKSIGSVSKTEGDQRTLISELEVEHENTTEFACTISDSTVDDISEDEIHEDDNAKLSHLTAGWNSNLSGMKLAELRALAKSRGLKGFSKLKKLDLIDLLSESSI